MPTKIHKNISVYMNAMSRTRTYNPYIVSAIASAIKEEYISRKNIGLKINGRTKKGQAEIDQRIAAIVNKKLKLRLPITAKDVRLYKRCWAQEYMDRTGKCAWGFKNARAQLGYDPDTGLESIC